MELCKKLQQLRKEKGITQEELAEALYVSRTAVSKWESGRGYPNIDSLKALAKFFDVTVDALLSGNELLTIAQEDTKRKQSRICDLVYGLLDCSVFMFFFLPVFRQRENGVIHEVSIMNVTAVAPYLRFLYWSIVLSIVVCGIATLALQHSERPFWIQSKSRVSLLFSGIGTALFVISLQPYAAMVFFVFFVIKTLILTKKQ